MPEGEFAQVAFAAHDADRRAFGAEGRPGDDVHHAICAVWPVKGRPGSQDDFDAFDVVVCNGNEVMGVEPQGRHARNPVVHQCKQGSGEHVVEAARDGVGLDEAGLGVVHARKPHDVIRGAQTALSLHGVGFNDRDGGRRIQDFFPPAGRRNDDLVSIKNLDVQTEVEVDPAAVGYPDVAPGRGLVSDERNGDFIDAVRQTCGLVHAVHAGDDLDGSL